jgi:tRNA 2-thiouridine synthesizing protein A
MNSIVSNGTQPCVTVAHKYRREESMGTIRVDVRYETCPVPLIETRKALRKASPGDIVEVIGTHPASKKEIPMAVEALKLELLGVEEEGPVWKIRIRR